MDNEILKNLILKWDRKHTETLKRIYKKNVLKSFFIDDIIEMYSTHDGLVLPTSWLIKHHLDNGETINETQINSVLKRMEELEYWGSQLHVLQIIPKVPLTQKQIEFIEPGVRKLLKSENKFVKAAAFEAYFEIIKFFPQLKNEFLIICEDALVKESASVKVKIRRILNAFKTNASNEIKLKPK